MSINKVYPNWIQGNNIITQGSGYSANTSLRNDGKTELRGDVFMTNSSKLIIGKDKNTTTNYDIDCQNNVNINGTITCNSYFSSAATMYIGTNNPFTELILNTLQIMVKRNGNIQIGGGSLNSNNNILIQGNNGGTIQIGGGSNNYSTGIINIGSTILNYKNIVNICASETVINVLNLGSSVNNININGQLICNSFLPSTTIINYIFII